MADKSKLEVLLEQVQGLTTANVAVWLQELFDELVLDNDPDLIDQVRDHHQRLEQLALQAGAQERWRTCIPYLNPTK